MPDIDTSNVDRMELRQRLAEQDETRKALVAAVDACGEHAELGALRDQLWAEQAALEEKYDQLRWAITDRFGALPDHPQVALDAHDLATEADFFNVSCDNGELVRCCVSGLVLLDDDVTVEDCEGRKALVSVLPWPEFETDDAD